MPNYRIRNAGPKTAEVWLYDVIGDSWFGGISARQFADDIKGLGTVDKILLRVNSEGGDVFDGIAMYNVLKRHPARVEADIDGMAASIASVIVMAADEIRMADNAMLMIHDPWAGAVGDAAQLRDLANRLDQVKDNLIGTYAARTGIDRERLADWMAAETWFTAADAVEAGFATSVTPALQIAACADLTRFRNVPATLRARMQEPAGADRRADMTRAKLADIQRRMRAYAPA